MALSRYLRRRALLFKLFHGLIVSRRYRQDVNIRNLIECVSWERKNHSYSLLSRRRRPKSLYNHWILVVFLHVTPNWLGKRGTTRSLDISKGEVFHAVHVWKWTINERTAFHNNREKHDVKSFKSIIECEDVSLFIGNFSDCDSGAPERPPSGAP